MSFAFDLALAREDELRRYASDPDRLASVDRQVQQRRAAVPSGRNMSAERLARLVDAVVRYMRGGHASGRLAHRVRLSH
jgi:hypothetical protein